MPKFSYKLKQKGSKSNWYGQGEIHFEGYGVKAIANVSNNVLESLMLTDNNYLFMQYYQFVMVQEGYVNPLGNITQVTQFSNKMVYGYTAFNKELQLKKQHQLYSFHNQVYYYEDLVTLFDKTRNYQISAIDPNLIQVYKDFDVFKIRIIPEIIITNIKNIVDFVSDDQANRLLLQNAKCSLDQIICELMDEEQDLMPDEMYNKAHKSKTYTLLSNQITYISDCIDRKIPSLMPPGPPNGLLRCMLNKKQDDMNFDLNDEIMLNRMYISIRQDYPSNYMAFLLEKSKEIFTQLYSKQEKSILYNQLKMIILSLDKAEQGDLTLMSRICQEWGFMSVYGSIVQMDEKDNEDVFKYAFYSIVDQFEVYTDLLALMLGSLIKEPCEKMDNFFNFSVPEAALDIQKLFRFCLKVILTHKKMKEATNYYSDTTPSFIKMHITLINYVLSSKNTLLVINEFKQKENVSPILNKIPLDQKNSDKILAFMNTLLQASKAQSYEGYKKVTQLESFVARKILKIYGIQFDVTQLNKIDQIKQFDKTYYVGHYEYKEFIKNQSVVKLINEEGDLITQKPNIVHCDQKALKSFNKTNYIVWPYYAHKFLNKTKGKINFDKFADNYDDICDNIDAIIQEVVDYEEDWDDALEDIQENIDELDEIFPPKTEYTGIRKSKDQDFQYQIHLSYYDLTEIAWQYHQELHTLLCMDDALLLRWNQVPRQNKLTKNFNRVYYNRKDPYNVYQLFTGSGIDNIKLGELLGLEKYRGRMEKLCDYFIDNKLNIVTQKKFNSKKLSYFIQDQAQKEQEERQEQVLGKYNIGQQIQQETSLSLYDKQFQSAQIQQAEKLLQGINQIQDVQEDLKSLGISDEIIKLLRQHQERSKYKNIDDFPQFFHSILMKNSNEQDKKQLMQQLDQVLQQGHKEIEARRMFTLPTRLGKYIDIDQSKATIKVLNDIQVRQELNQIYQDLPDLVTSGNLYIQTDTYGLIISKIYKISKRFSKDTYLQQQHKNLYAILNIVSAILNDCHVQDDIQNNQLGKTLLKLIERVQNDLGIQKAQAGQLKAQVDYELNIDLNQHRKYRDI